MRKRPIEIVGDRHGHHFLFFYICFHKKSITLGINFAKKFNRLFFKDFFMLFRYEEKKARRRSMMEQRSNIKGRLIAALIIALIGIFMYWHRTEVNPITGETQ